MLPGLNSLVVAQNMRPDSSSFSLGLHSLAFGSNIEHGFGFEGSLMGVKSLSDNDFVSASIYYHSPNQNRLGQTQALAKFILSADYTKLWFLNNHNTISSKSNLSFGSELQNSANFELFLISETVSHIYNFGNNNSMYWASGVKGVLGRFSDDGLYPLLPNFGMTQSPGFYPTLEFGLQPKKRAHNWNFLLNGILDEQEITLSFILIRKF